MALEVTATDNFINGHKMALVQLIQDECPFIPIFCSLAQLLQLQYGSKIAPTLHPEDLTPTEKCDQLLAVCRDPAMHLLDYSH